MLDPVAQLFQHCWGEGGALHKVSLEFTTFYGLRSSHDAVQVPATLSNTNTFGSGTKCVAVLER